MKNWIKHLFSINWRITKIKLQKSYKNIFQKCFCNFFAQIELLCAVFFCDSRKLILYHFVVYFCIRCKCLKINQFQENIYRITNYTFLIEKVTYMVEKKIWQRNRKNIISALTATKNFQRFAVYFPQKKHAYRTNRITRPLYSKIPQRFHKDSGKIPQRFPKRKTA